MRTGQFGFAKDSALGFEFLIFLTTIAFTGKSYAPMKSVQLGARIALTALPLGILCSLAVRSLDASVYGISVLPVAVFFIFKGLVTSEGFNPDEIKAKRLRMLRRFLRLDKR